MPDERCKKTVTVSGRDFRCNMLAGHEGQHTAVRKDQDRTCNVMLTWPVVYGCADPRGVARLQEDDHA